MEVTSGKTFSSRKIKNRGTRPVEIDERKVTDRRDGKAVFTSLIYNKW